MPPGWTRRGWSRCSPARCGISMTVAARHPCLAPVTATAGRKAHGGGSGMNVIETSGLGKRYGRTWALKDAALAIPASYVVALVGPNGAGKTTLLHMSVGLTVPTTGQVTVLDSEPAGSPAALDQIAFVAQDAPLYKNLSVTDMLHLTRNLNRRWD